MKQYIEIIVNSAFNPSLFENFIYMFLYFPTAADSTKLELLGTDDKGSDF